MTRHRPALLAAAVALMLPLGLMLAPAATATAASYPSWNDVVEARGSAAKTQALIARIEDSLSALKRTASDAAAAARTAGDAAQKADDAYQAQVLVVQELGTQVDDATSEASAARTRLARLVAAEYRGQGLDPTLDILLNSGDAADRLQAYSTSEHIEGEEAQLLGQAQQTANTVSSLKKQATTAQDALDADKQQAESTLADATSASEKAQQSLAAEQVHERDLQALLAAAKSKATTTYAQYRAGVTAREKAAEKKRQQQGQGDPAPVSSSGWTLPARGPITSPYGWRTLFGQPEFHRGTDIGAACGAPEYAAHDGTITYAGWNGVYGYYVGVNTGGGVEVDYGHIEEGGILVSVGQHVSEGQVIARVGTTGTSTGCHLFFGVKVNGVQTDPQPFMSARGVTLGTY